MNNNMPNNFNNGVSGGLGANNFNNNQGNLEPNNNFVNPAVEKANEQMMGGQSQVGNGPSVMQGMADVNKEQGAMQGVNNVQNKPGIMQGNSMPNQNTLNQSVSSQPVMPGQTNSGINSYTMQNEPKDKTNSEVLSIPGFSASNNNVAGPQQSVNVPNFNNVNVPNQPVSNQNVPNQNHVDQVKVPNMGGIQAPNNNINNVYNQNVNQQNSVNRPLEPQPNNFDNNYGQSSLKNNSNGVNNTNNAPKTEIKNMNENFKSMNSLNQSNMTKPNNVSNQQMANNNQSSTIEKGNVSSLNNTVGGIKPTSIGSSVSQVGQTESNSINQMNQGYQVPPKKKFPLSVREMVLIGIAIIGIVVVIIMYT